MLALRYRSNNKERCPPHIPLPPIIQGKAKRHLALLTRPNLTQPIAPSPIGSYSCVQRSLGGWMRAPRETLVTPPTSNRLVDLNRN